MKFITFLLAVAGVTFLFWSKRRKPVMDSEFGGSAPRFSGAMSAVTGGPPEDINLMPPTEEPEKEGPTYDGSRLSSYGLRVLQEMR